MENSKSLLTQLNIVQHNFKYFSSLSLSFLSLSLFSLNWVENNLYELRSAKEIVLQLL